MFANGPGDQGSIPDQAIPKIQKMVFDTSLPNTQHYKVCIKGKVKQSKERNSTLSLHLNVVTIEKGAFGSPSTTITNFIYLYLYEKDLALNNLPWLICHKTKPIKFAKFPK